MHLCFIHLYTESWMATCSYIGMNSYIYIAITIVLQLVLIYYSPTCCRTGFRIEEPGTADSSSLATSFSIAMTVRDGCKGPSRTTAHRWPCTPDMLPRRPQLHSKIVYVRMTHLYCAYSTRQGYTFLSPEIAH